MKSFITYVIGLFLLFAVQGVSAQHSGGCQSATINITQLEDQLKTKGLVGHIHGSSQKYGLYVFTYRHPQCFFVHAEFPLTAEDKKMRALLATLSRHDQVLVQGSYRKGKAPIKHIKVQTLKITKKWQGPGHDKNHKYQAKIADIFRKSGGSIVVKVHAVSAGGHVLVVEYKDLVVPVFNKKADLAKNLFRNDKIRLHYDVRSEPVKPTHVQVMTSSKVPQPIELLTAITDGHGQKVTLEGPLVMFPESPQIIFDVFALRVEDSFGLRINYTLVNFTDMDVFTKIRKKLGSEWANYIKSSEYDRNKFINRKLWVRATGTKNVIHPSQANPQILLDSADDITFIEK